MPRINRDNLRIDVEGITPLKSDEPPRPWLNQLCASYFFADMHRCLLRLGVQSGVGEEVLQNRIKGSGEALGEATADLVNRCVDGWKDHVVRGRNPGIMHDDLAVPSDHAGAVLRQIRSFASYSNGELPEELQVEPVTLRRVLEGTAYLRGGAYFASVRILAQLVSKPRSTIIGNRVLFGLSHRPPERIEFLGTPGSVAPLAEAKPARIYDIDDLLKKAKSPGQLRHDWEAYPSMPYGDKIRIIREIKTGLRGSKITESDIQASLNTYHGLNGR